jgi:hypothetical protein
MRRSECPLRDPSTNSHDPDLTAAPEVNVHSVIAITLLLIVLLVVCGRITK